MLSYEDEKLLREEMSNPQNCGGCRLVSRMLLKLIRELDQKEEYEREQKERE